MNIDQWREKFNQDPGFGVVSVEPAQSNLGNGILLKKSVEITYADGSKAYGCTWDDCDTVAPHPTSIGTVHWNEHEPRTKRAYVRKPDYSDWTMREMATALTEAEAKIIRAERARSRALDQARTVREVTREAMAALRAELDAAIAERDAVRAAAQTLFPAVRAAL